MDAEILAATASPTVGREGDVVDSNAVLDRRAEGPPGTPLDDDGLAKHEAHDPGLIALTWEGNGWERVVLKLSRAGAPCG